MITAQEFEERERKAQEAALEQLKNSAFLVVEDALNNRIKTATVYVPSDAETIPSLPKLIQEDLNKKIEPFGWLVAKCYVTDGGPFGLSKLRIQVVPL